MKLSSAILAGWASAALAAGLKDIDHVVLFMQENRAFDHYYGSMAGVRGFKDPNVKLRENGKPVWYQPTNTSDDLLPYYLSADPEYADSNQCNLYGGNSWTDFHGQFNFGKNDGWVLNNTPYSWGYFRREDVPTHFSLVEGWTVADMYAESVIGPTCPNRVTWMSGSINTGNILGPGTTVGGPYIDNLATEECEYDSQGRAYSCFPLKWKTHPEYLQDEGVDWQVFQDKDNFDDNPLGYFAQYRDAPADSDLLKRGNSFEQGLDDFVKRAENGTLPAVSYIVGEMELSEHPPNLPIDGEWRTLQIINAVLNSPKYNSTALIVSYDETGGVGPEHVVPFVPPKDTPGEWQINYEAENGTKEEMMPSGPGFRVPLYVISPWTRGGRVYTAPGDHNSQIKFLEQWIMERFDKNVTTEEMGQWRRDNMDDLVNMFDFENPDYSIPKLVDAREPEKKDGAWVGPGRCNAQWDNRHPPIPYGKQNETDALWTEQGYKEVRGNLTEGRYLVFSGNGGKCVATSSNKLSSGDCSKDYSSESQRFIVHQQGDVFATKFKLQAFGGGYLKGTGFVKSLKEGDTLDINFSSTRGYSVQNADGEYLSADGFQSNEHYFKLYSVAYD